MRKEPIDRRRLPSPALTSEVGRRGLGRVAGGVGQRRAVGAVGRRAGRCRRAPARGTWGGALGAGVGGGGVDREGLPVGSCRSRQCNRTRAEHVRLSLESARRCGCHRATSEGRSNAVRRNRSSLPITRVPPLPSAPITMFSSVAVAVEMSENTMREPSGDQSGDDGRMSPGSDRCPGRLPSDLIAEIRQSAAVRDARAVRRPSPVRLIRSRRVLRPCAGPSHRRSRSTCRLAAA